MATRFYLSNTAPSVSPAFSAPWGDTTNTLRNMMGTADTISDGDLISGSSFPEISGTTIDVLAIQYVSNEQVPENVVIGGSGVTLSAVMHMKESHANGDGFLQIRARVVSANGVTTRGVLYSGTTNTTVSDTVGAINEELTINPGATRIIDMVTTSAVSAQAGDRIVVEVGVRQTNTTDVSRGFFIRRGYESTASDYALTSGLTDLIGNPWIEISQNVFSSSTLAASAGSDKTVKALTLTTIAGSPSGGSGNFTHSWTQTSGPTVTLSGTGATRTFKSPGILGGTTLSFQYSASSGGLSASDSIAIDVNAPPIWFKNGANTYSPGRIVMGGDDGGVIQPDPYPLMQAMSATQFKSYFGTRIFPSYSGKTGGELLTNIQWLTNLGVKWVSHKMSPAIAGNSSLMNFFNQLGEAGIQSCFTMGEPREVYTANQMNSMVSAIAGLASQGYIKMVTGRNEVNHVRGGGTLPASWAQDEAVYQQDLYTRIKNVNPNIIVGSPCLWSGDLGTHQSDLNALAPLVRNYSDYGVYHLYPRGSHPDWNLDSFLNLYDTAYNGKPSICTEAGYFAAANYTGGAVGVTEWAHDIYIRKMWLEYAKRGVAISQFEFVADPDPSESNREAWFGLIRTPAVSASTWVARPAYNNLRSVLTSLSGGNNDTVGCSVTTSGNVQRLIVKHAGGHKLFLWRRDDIEKNYTPTTITPVQVRVESLAGGLQTVSVSADVVALDI